MRTFFTPLIAALTLSACAMHIPVTLPAEGTTATITTDSRTTTRRPIGAVQVITETNTQSNITVRNTPPRYRRDGPYRGETIIGCNRVGDVWQYLDTGYVAPSLCRPMQSTDARPRSTYRAVDGRCYTIMEFGVGFSRYFTAIPGGRCQSYHRY